MGNGTIIRCWKDHWIPGLGPLINNISVYANLDLECYLKDMVLKDGTWNLDLFRIWLPEDVIFHILSVPPSHPSAGMDRIIWAPSTSGKFSVRGAYWALKQDTWDPKEQY